VQTFFIIGFVIAVFILHHLYKRKQLIKSTMEQYRFDHATAKVFLHRKHAIMFEFRKRSEQLPCDEIGNAEYKRLHVKVLEEIDDLVEVLRDH
jgi:hypothetical protein